MFRPIYLTYYVSAGLYLVANITDDLAEMGFVSPTNIDELLRLLAVSLFSVKFVADLITNFRTGVVGTGVSAIRRVDSNRDFWSMIFLKFLVLPVCTLVFYLNVADFL